MFLKDKRTECANQCAEGGATINMMRVSLAILLFASLVFSIASISEAQKPAKPKSGAVGPKYVCLVCKIGADKQAKCPVCNLQVAKAGVYVCLSCGAMADKSGDCTTCKKPMSKLADLAKKCKVCGYYSDKNKKECPVCELRKKQRQQKQ